jgi:hypothetical protein
MPILGFNVYNPDKKNIPDFSKNELQLLANSMYMISSIRAILMVVVSVTQIDIALWTVLSSEITSFFTIRMLLNEKTFNADPNETLKLVSDVNVATDDATDDAFKNDEEIC